MLKIIVPALLATATLGAKYGHVDRVARGECVRGLARWLGIGAGEMACRVCLRV